MPAAILTKQLKQLPASPGVYEFFNSAGDLLYVGKAKSLRSRVKSYFQKSSSLSAAKQIMVREAHHLAYTEVANEAEALLLEGNLIKQHRPPYNVVLKDDKSWLYIAIDYREPYPRVTVERRPAAHGVRYFGPYPAASTARYSLRLLKKVLSLRTCKNPAAKPCFDASLGRCLGHNLGPGSRTRYLKQLKNLEHVLRGNVQTLITQLTKRMQQAAKQKQFELAAKLRDQRNALEKLAVKQNVLSASRESYDVFGLDQGSTTAAIVRLPVRSGVALEPERFLISQPAKFTAAETITGFLEQYYPVLSERPRRAYVPVELEIPSILNVHLQLPKRGQKRSLIKLAEAAARAHLTGSAASWERRQARAEAGLVELKEILGLPDLPHRIEGYDISNIQGKDAVGSLVVLTEGVPDNSQYRKFRIQGPGTPNDFAMLAQVLTRRFTKNIDWPAPDLVMLDGGAGQLSAVLHALKEVKTKVPLVALAKREEELYLPSIREPIKLPRDNAGLMLLMELRDEAHRFGIGFFRAKHRRSQAVSGWDELPGVGPVTKRRLKRAFGTLANVRRATTQELAKAIGQQRAKELKEHLA